jgi:RNA-directed DNA polymerase
MIKPTIKLQELQARIGDRAKSAPAHRFWGLAVHIKKPEVIERAYLEARKNKGSPGIDRVTFEQIEEQGRAHYLREIVDALEQGTYRPQPYRKREIPKANGKVRTISIPTIRDRVVHGAMKLILEPIFEADFSDSSFGARPGRRAHEAIDSVRQGLRQHQHRVVDLDLADFFGSLTHHVLLSRVAKRVQDPEVMAMLKQFLKGAGKHGIPQGSPLSPLLANIALTELDNALDRGKGTIIYVRYLDDMVVLAHDTPKGRLWADRALSRIRREAKAIGVDINEEKTRVVTVTDPHASFAFLGFDFRWKSSAKSGKYYPYTVPRHKKILFIQKKVRELLSGNRHLAVREIVKLLNPILRGWVNYFRVGNSANAFGKVRHYVELRVRRFVAKQRKRHGFGWKRWSNDIVYKQWGLFNSYKIHYYAVAKGAAFSKRIINPV